MYKQVRQLTSVESAYIAGIIDGEGSISLSRRHKNENRQLVVSISSTELELLEYIKTTVGAGRITKKRTYQPVHAAGMTYAIDNRQALELLKSVAPYLKTYKAKRAKLILDHYIRLTPRNGKYTDALFQERELFVERFLSIYPNSSEMDY